MDGEHGGKLEGTDGPTPPNAGPTEGGCRHHTVRSSEAAPGARRTPGGAAGAFQEPLRGSDMALPRFRQAVGSQPLASSVPQSFPLFLDVLE